MKTALSFNYPDPSRDDCQVLVEARRPRRRDALAVLLGRYEPVVQERPLINMARVSADLKEVWTAPSCFSNDSPILAWVENERRRVEVDPFNWNGNQATIPIQAGVKLPEPPARRTLGQRLLRWAAHR